MIKGEDFLLSCPHTHGGGGEKEKNGHSRWREERRETSCSKRKGAYELLRNN